MLHAGHNGHIRGTRRGHYLTYAMLFQQRYYNLNITLCGIIFSFHLQVIISLKV